MNVKDHYYNHLGNFYSWTNSDLSSRVHDFRKLLESHQITSSTNELAVDLGAGHGIQTIALTECGFNVTAIDFNDQLLTELASNTNGKNVTIINDDMRNVRQHATDASIIVCCGDTITHLTNYDEIMKFATDIFHSLKAGGKAIFSFRDYSIPLEGTNRFIPVKSDENRILTCILDYSDRAPKFVDDLKEIGFKILNSDVVNRLTTIIAQRNK